MKKTSIACAFVLLYASTPVLAQQTAKSEERVFEFQPSKTTVTWTLDATLHTVHGTFDLKKGAARFNPATGELGGEIIVDATSAKSGIDGRDRKMHKDVLESARYPEIVFRPDRVEGSVLPQGISTIQIHGKFSIHGAEHEMSVPTQVRIAADGWTAETTFMVPYVKWGMKNPSNLFLHVKSEVELTVHASGTF